MLDFLNMGKASYSPMQEPVTRGEFINHTESDRTIRMLDDEKAKVERGLLEKRIEELEGRIRAIEAHLVL